jgi:hypothetical protein
MPQEDVATVWRVLGEMMERAQGMVDEEQRLDG